jgi:hypothetical protein
MLFEGTAPSADDLLAEAQEAPGPADNKPPSKPPARAPRYSVAGLFESGTLGLEAETALEEIRSITTGFERWVSPSKGWLTPRLSDNRPPIPRSLGVGGPWGRYRSWRVRWQRRILSPSASLPWGLTAGGLVVALVTTPLTFEQAATVLRWDILRVVDLFVKVLDDYGRGEGEAFEPFYVGRRSKRRSGKGKAARHKKWGK